MFFQFLCYISLVLAQEWWDVSAQGHARTFLGQPASPYKPNKVAPLRSMPGGNNPECIKPDLMHIFNLGFGGDLAVGAILALQRLRVWGPPTMQKGLDVASV